MSPRSPKGFHSKGGGGITPFTHCHDCKAPNQPCLALAIFGQIEKLKHDKQIWDKEELEKRMDPDNLYPNCLTSSIYRKALAEAQRALKEIPVDPPMPTSPIHIPPEGTRDRFTADSLSQEAKKNLLNYHAPDGARPLTHDELVRSKKYVPYDILELLNGYPPGELREKILEIMVRQYLPDEADNNPQRRK